MDFPVKNGDFPWQNVCSPEGKIPVNSIKPPFSYGFPMVFHININKYADSPYMLAIRHQLPRHLRGRPPAPPATPATLKSESGATPDAGRGACNYIGYQLVNIPFKP